MNQHSLPSSPADDPLSSRVLGRSGGWGNLAQQYPIFSQTWFKYRALSYILPVSLVGLFVALSLFVIPTGNAKTTFQFAMIFLWLSVVSALLLGRGLAVLILKKNWPEKNGSIAVVLAIIFGIIVALVLVHLEHNFEKEFTQEYIQELKLKKQTDLAVVDSESMYENSPAIAAVRYGLILLLFLWLGGALDLISYFRQRKAMKDVLIEQRLALYKKERNEAELRLSVLASQVEPHFLFNTLSGVRSAIQSDPQMGVAIIDNLVEYLRATIPQLRNDGSSSQVKLGSQLQAIRAYLGVIKFRIPRLSFEVEFEPTLSDLFIPPLMLISLVENAVKHGIELKKGAAHIWVKAEKITIGGEDRLMLTVRDNGLGFTETVSGSGIGLSNIRERLRQIYQDHASLTLETNEEGGVTACILLPTDTFI